MSNALWDRIGEVRIDEGYGGDIDIPEDAFTAEEYAAKFPVKDANGKDKPIARGTAVSQCRALVRKGIFGCGMQVRLNGGRYQNSKVYWLKEAPNAKEPVVGRAGAKRSRKHSG